jgi:hypothetical protein
MPTYFLPKQSQDEDFGKPFYFNKLEGAGHIDFTTPLPDSLTPGLTNSVLVSSAGSININGTYIYVTELNNRAYYTKGGGGIFFIVYLDNQWNIFDYSISVNAIYFSSEDVLYPWLVNNWQVLNSIYLPLPSVTKILD